MTSHSSDPHAVRLAGSGLLFNPWEPEPEIWKVLPLDIGIGLGNLCRFGGQIFSRASGESRFYSVAQHCVQGLAWIPESDRRLRLLWLLHDAPEALGFVDVPRPVKQHPSMQAYREAEERLQMAVWRQLGGITPTVTEIDAIKDLDDRMLAKEQAMLKNTSNFALWMPHQSTREFMAAIGELR